MSSELPAAVSLPDFLDSHEAGTLSTDDRRLIVDQALIVLEQNYALLGFKAARYGIDPLRRLRLLRARLDRAGEPEPEWRFHAELVDIFNSLRDLHTRYTLPRPFNAAAVHLPFLLREFTEDGRSRYLVGRVAADQPELHGTFRFGVEITHWNGVPIARAVERLAERMPGANPEARHARGVEMFTFRSLAFGPPPDDDWVNIRYVDHDGEVRFIDLVWTVRPFVPELADGAATAVPLGLDVEGARLARLRTQLYAPEFIAAEESGEPVAPGPESVVVSPEWSTVFEARRVSAGGREFGHLRIRTFRPPAPPTAQQVFGFVREFIRLLGELPQDGLVVDIRGNLGGAIWASEMCLQALTARPVEPEPTQFAATALNLRLCRTDDGLTAWVRSLDQALDSGADHSAAVPLTPPEFLRAVPQAYFGPVVLVTNARCYSAADIFAAGFQDAGIGPVLGVDGNTGAGGGNVWRMEHLLDAGEGFPFQRLPGDADLSFVIRRLLRVGPNAGTPLEDYGVIADVRHLPTRRDVTGGDADLMAAAAGLLGKGVARRFDVELTETGGDLTATFSVLGVDRADIGAAGRPCVSVDLGANPGPVPVPVTATPESVRVDGYAGGELVAVRNFVRTDGKLRPYTTFES